MKSKEVKFQNKLTKLRGLKVYAEAPTADLEQFSGNISLLGGGVHKDMDIRHFLLKGSVMKNSGIVDDMVIFTGEDTKIQMNWGQYKTRQSQLDMSINWITICNLVSLFVLILICSLSNYLWL
jgi:magnesium-transporting ATPase (P-type)